MPLSPVTICDYSKHIMENRWKSSSYLDWCQLYITRVTQTKRTHISWSFVPQLDFWNPDIFLTFFVIILFYRNEVDPEISVKALLTSAGADFWAEQLCWDADYQYHLFPEKKSYTQKPKRNAKTIRYMYMTFECWRKKLQPALYLTLLGHFFSAEICENNEHVCWLLSLQLSI